MYNHPKNVITVLAIEGRTEHHLSHIHSTKGQTMHDYTLLVKEGGIKIASLL